MHITRSRQAELRYALLYAQANEITITDFFEQVADAREAVWLYSWLSRYSRYEQERLDRQFEVHALLLQVIEGSRPEEDLRTLSKSDARTAERILKAKIAQIEQRKREQTGAPMKWRDSNARAGKDTLGHDRPDRLLHVDSVDFGQGNEIELEEEELITNEQECIEDTNRNTSAQEDDSTVCPLPEEEERA